MVHSSGCMGYDFGISCREPYQIRMCINKTLYRYLTSRNTGMWLPRHLCQGLVFKRSTSELNWNLEVLVFVEGLPGKPENPEKSPGGKTRTKNKLT